MKDWRSILGSKADLGLESISLCDFAVRVFC